MHRVPASLGKRLDGRAAQDALRELRPVGALIDLSSNDYLGFGADESLFDEASVLAGHPKNGSTGSRLITGNHDLYSIAEARVAHFHEAEAALIFNSGYDANLGVFSSIPQRGDIVLFDEYCHASIRDGLRLSQARAFKFAHNDLEDLERLLESCRESTVYVATETVFSMDGDSPPLVRLLELCEKYGAFLILDEAHALGVFGPHGAGLVQDHQLHQRVFARVVTYGKALGCHGASVLGPKILKEYLVNFARSFIYTTALPPHSVATIVLAYGKLEQATVTIEKLRANILHFSREVARLGMVPVFVGGKSAIASAIIPGNERVRIIARRVQDAGFDVRPILSPTVPQGQERLRFCIHAFNTPEQITSVLELLAKTLFS